VVNRAIKIPNKECGIKNNGCMQNLKEVLRIMKSGGDVDLVQNL
jgi:hypothetical protein